MTVQHPRLGDTRTAKPILANPNLWHQYLGEVFKWRRHRLFHFLVYAPFALVALYVFGVATSLRGQSIQNLPNIDNYYFNQFGPPTYDLGSQGAFVMAGQGLLGGFLALYTFGFVLGCVWCVHNEFNWKTIKMLASRQPSRVQIVLSKVLFIATLALACFLSLLIAWVVTALFLKLAYRAPLGLTPADVEALGKGTAHLILRSLANVLWGLLAMSATFWLKSAAGGFIIYFIYSAWEGFMSNLGAFVTNNAREFINLEGIFQFVVAAAQALYPYLLTTHLNRITMVPQSPQVVASIPLEVSWIAVIVYGAAFVGLALAIFLPRDIKE
jgi:ABC-type transport system involved in multi-copper enzyme maturation permease subunit